MGVFRKTAVVPVEEAVGGPCPSREGRKAFGGACSGLIRRHSLFHASGRIHGLPPARLRRGATDRYPLFGKYSLQRRSTVRATSGEEATSGG